MHTHHHSPNPLKHTHKPLLFIPTTIHPHTHAQNHNPRRDQPPRHHRRRAHAPRPPRPAHLHPHARLRVPPRHPQGKAWRACIHIMIIYVWVWVFVSGACGWVDVVRPCGDISISIHTIRAKQPPAPRLSLSHTHTHTHPTPIPNAITTGDPPQIAHQQGGEPRVPGRPDREVHRCVPFSLARLPLFCIWIHSTHAIGRPIEIVLYINIYKHHTNILTPTYPHTYLPYSQPNRRGPDINIYSTAPQLPLHTHKST